MNQTYQQYLKSGHWIRLRKSALERDGNQCVKCRSQVDLQVHHLRYMPNLYDTILSDVETLCEPCHLKNHMRLEQETGHKSRSLNMREIPDFKTWHAMYLSASGMVGIVFRAWYYEQLWAHFNIHHPEDPLTQEMIGRVIAFVNRQIRQKKRERSSLRLDMLLSPERFEYDLSEARAIARRPARSAKEQILADWRGYSDTGMKDTSRSAKQVLVETLDSTSSASAEKAFEDFKKLKETLK